MEYMISLYIVRAFVIGGFLVGGLLSVAARRSDSNAAHVFAGFALGCGFVGLSSLLHP